MYIMCVILCLFSTLSCRVGALKLSIINIILMHPTHHIDQEDLGGVLLVVPVFVVQPLSQQLDGRLGAVLLFGRHAQVIHKHHRLLVHGRAIHTLAAPEKQ